MNPKFRVQSDKSFGEQRSDIQPNSAFVPRFNELADRNPLSTPAKHLWMNSNHAQRDFNKQLSNETAQMSIKSSQTAFKSFSTDTQTQSSELAYQDLSKYLLGD